MSRGVKITLIVVGVIVLLVVVCIGGAVFFFGKVKQEATTFAQQTDQAGCMKEVMSRQKRNDSGTSVISNGTFLAVCLESSKRTPGFCDGIPPSSNREKTSQWVNQQCNQAGLNLGTCAGLMTIAQKHCESGTRK